MSVERGSEARESCARVTRCTSAVAGTHVPVRVYDTRTFHIGGTENARLGTDVFPGRHSRRGLWFWWSCHCLGRYREDPVLHLSRGLRDHARDGPYRPSQHGLTGLAGLSGTRRSRRGHLRGATTTRTGPPTRQTVLPTSSATSNSFPRIATPTGRPYALPSRTKSVSTSTGGPDG